jgi:hypothetical protein
VDGIDVVNGVVGALGMLFAVLFQQPLQDAWYRLRRRSTSAIRSLGRRDESVPAWRAFSAEESERLQAEGRTPLWNGPR